MTRRDFIAGMIAAAVAPRFLPGAGRIWKPAPLAPILCCDSDGVGLELPEGLFGPPRVDNMMFHGRTILRYSKPGDVVVYGRERWRMVRAFDLFSGRDYGVVDHDGEFVENKRLTKFWAVPINQEAKSYYHSALKGSRAILYEKDYPGYTLLSPEQQAEFWTGEEVTHD